MVKTKKKILQEFKNLLDKHDMDKITVCDIANNCNIKRQTFYYHFSNLNELISYGAKCYINDIIEGKRFATWQDKFEYILDNIKKDKDSFIRIILQKTSYDIGKCVYDIFEDNVRETISGFKKEYNILINDEDFITSFYCFGLSGIVLKWFDNGMKEEPKILVHKIDMIIDGTTQRAFQKFAA